MVLGVRNIMRTLRAEICRLSSNQDRAALVPVASSSLYNLPKPVRCTNYTPHEQHLYNAPHTQLHLSQTITAPCA